MNKRKSSLVKHLLSFIKNRKQQRRQHDMVNLIRYLQNPNLSIHDEHYADDILFVGSITKDGFVKTATTLFFRLFWTVIKEKVTMKVFSKNFRHTLSISQTPLPPS